MERDRLIRAILAALLVFFATATLVLGYMYYDEVTGNDGLLDNDSTEATEE